MSTLVSTGFKLPTTVISNGAGNNGWQTPQNLFYVDGQFAISTGVTNVVVVGNFNSNVPQDSLITNITIRVKGYRGSFNTTLQIYAVDDTTGTTFSYPYTPAFQGFDGTNTLYTLTPSLFGTTWTVNQINNIKIQLIANGELYLDSIEVDVQYQPNNIVPPTPTPGGDTVCCEFVQGQEFTLAESMTNTGLFFYADSFNYPNGDPIQIGDFYGSAFITVDQGVPGSEENMMITNVQHNYNGTNLVRISMFVGNDESNPSLDNRGVEFQYPYAHDITLCNAHQGTANFVISNSAPFYNRFLKKCQIDALVSAPIVVEDEGVVATEHVHGMNFTGAGVTVTIPDPSNPDNLDIVIPGAGGTTPPVIATTSSATSGNVQVPSLTWNHVSTGINRDLTVQVSLEGGKTVTGITFNGSPLSFVVAQTLNGVRSEIWNLVSPIVGTYPIVVSFSSASYSCAGAETIVGVDQTNPIGSNQAASGNSSTALVSVTTIYDNSLVVDSLSTGITPIVYLPGPSQAINWSHTLNTDTREGGSTVQMAGSSGDVVVSYIGLTQTTDWAYCGIEIKGVTSPIASISTQENGSTIDAGTIQYNFTGAGQTATQTSTGHVTINIPAAPSGSQAAIQFDDASGTPLGAPGTVDEFEITGSAVTAAVRVGNKVTYTVSQSGSGGIAGPNINFLFAATGDGGTDPLQNIAQITKFQGWLFADLLGTGNTASSSIRQFATDSITGAVIEQSFALTFITSGTSNLGYGICTSEDGNSLYTLGCQGSQGSSSYTLEIRQYNTSLALVQTSVYTSGSNHWAFEGGGQGAIIPFFVASGHLVCAITFGSGPTTNGLWTDYTIAGASLTTPTATNLAFQTFPGPSRVLHQCATYKQGNAYLQQYSTGTGILSDIQQYSYSGTTLTLLTTSVSPIKEWSALSNPHHGGFEVTASTTIGRWRNTTIAENTSPVRYWSSGVYNNYTL